MKKYKHLLIVLLSILTAGLLVSSCYTQLAMVKHEQAYVSDFDQNDEYDEQTRSDTLYYEDQGGTEINNYYFDRDPLLYTRFGFSRFDPFFWDDYYPDMYLDFYYSDYYYNWPYLGWYRPIYVVGIPGWYYWYHPRWGYDGYVPPFKQRSFARGGWTSRPGGSSRVTRTSGRAHTTSRTVVRRNSDGFENSTKAVRVVKGKSGSTSSATAVRTAVRTTKRSTGKSRVRKGRRTYKVIYPANGNRRIRVVKRANSGRSVKKIRKASSGKSRSRSSGTKTRVRSSKKSGRSSYRATPVRRSGSSNSNRSHSSHRSSYSPTRSSSSYSSGSWSRSSSSVSSHRSSRSGSSRSSHSSRRR